MNYSIANSDTIQLQPFDPMRYAQSAKARKKRLFPPAIKHVAEPVNVVEIEARHQEHIQEITTKHDERVAELIARIEQLKADNARLTDLFSKVTSAKASVPKARDIIECVLQRYPEYTVEDILGKRRERQLADIRHLCMFEVARLRPDMSYPEMGRLFRRDHTTVLHGVRKIAREQKFERWSE